MASGCVNRPARFFILPDPVTPFCVSATSQAGPNPGVATTISQGNLIPVQSGDALSDSVATEYKYQIIKAGGVDSGEFAWQRTDEAKWYGTNDIRHFWGYNSATSTTSLTASACAVYQRKTRNKIVIYRHASTVLRVFFRSADASTPYITKSGPVQHSISVSIGNNYTNLASCESYDGSILLAVRDQNQRVHIFRSEDPSVPNSFVLVSEDIVGQALGAGTVLASDQTCQIRIASSGNWVRVCWITQLTASPPAGTYGTLATFHSADNGATWEKSVSSINIRATDSAYDRVPFDIIGVDDSGTFALSAVIFSPLGLSVGWLAAATARQDGDWFFTGNTVHTVDGTIYRLCMAKNDKYVYAYAYYVDRSLVTQPHLWTVFRSEQSLLIGENASMTASWEALGYPIYENDTAQWMPSSVFACWAGSELFFVSAVANAVTGNLVNGHSEFYSYGWTERSIGLRGPSVRISDLDGAGWNQQWCVAQGDPLTSGRHWTLSAFGALSLGISQVRLIVIINGGYSYYQTDSGTALGPAVWYATGGCWRFVAHRVSGTTSLGLDITGADSGINKYWRLVVYITSNSLVLYDNNTQLQSILVDTNQIFDIRVYVGVNRACRVALYGYTTREWYTFSAVTLADLTGPRISEIKFGVFPIEAGTLTFYWYEAQCTTDGDYMNQDKTFNSPYDLFGGLTTAEPQYIEEGLSVSWAGSGGYRGDTWTGNVSYTYPKEAVFVDSPRIAWRSAANAFAQNDIIVRAGPSDAVSDNYYTFVHDAVAVFGTNNRYIQIAYDDTETFSSPTATATIDCTLFGGQTFTIASTQRASITLSGSSFPWSTGDLVGCYVENTAVSGAAARITRHLAPGVLQLDSINGDATSAGFPAGNTIVIYAPYGFTTFTRVNERYMRIRVPYWSAVSEGYYTIGTVVAGVKLDVDVPMDWAHTDDEQPNVTSYRTKSGITWAFAEGPAQRTITGRVVGDAEQWRQKFRALLRQVNYEGKAVALGADTGTVFKNIMLGRVKSGSALDNAGYYIDGNGYLRPAGDMSLTFVEEK